LFQRARIIGVALLVTLTGCRATQDRPPAAAGAATGAATVERVVDGDTVIVHLSGQRERVRMLGINTPESVKPNAAVDCYGPESSRRTHELLPPGTAVRLVGDVEARDRYKRLLAYVYRSADNLFVNLVLVREGFARSDIVRPNVAHAPEIARAVADARGAGRGLWGHCHK
jgi:micrococcal nuclease